MDNSHEPLCREVENESLLVDSMQVRYICFHGEQQHYITVTSYLHYTTVPFLYMT